MPWQATSALSAVVADSGLQGFLPLGPISVSQAEGLRGLAGDHGSPVSVASSLRAWPVRSRRSSPSGVTCRRREQHYAA